MAAAASSSSSFSSGKKRVREENDEINWKTHVFKIGEKLSFIHEPECLWNDIEVIEILKKPGKPQQMLIRYFGWHFEFQVIVCEQHARSIRLST